MKPSKADHDRRSPVCRKRRAFTSLALAAPFIMLPTRESRAAGRSLRFYHTHTGERLEVVYREHDHYLRQSLAELQHFLRDFRSGESHPINPALFDLLYQAREMTGGRKAFQVISGYRSPATNEMLRGRSSSSGVAKKSLHMTGNALDIRLDGVSTSKLRKAAISLARGGVGYYPKSDFIHVDTGRVRSW